jgi:hypothetical protein
MKQACLMTCLAIATTVVAAQTSSSSSAKSGTPASLAATLKLIQEKVNSQGEIRYTMISENTVQGGSVEDQYAVESSGAVANPRSCSLQVNARMSMNNKTQTQGRATVPFREITKVVVRTQSQVIEEKTARAGVTGWKGKITPDSYVVQTFQDGNLYGMFFFRDADAANLVAKSISQAIQLCGGKVK